ncbi:MAG: hypothetical protein DRJ05_05585 [Bacteroidetes bacterium]|nr:MAG: hypothetical protein DRJ05_05585 [Bacteroidota bacterium]
MRNEVFKKISQNRKRYLIENSRIEISNEERFEGPGAKMERPVIKSHSSSGKKNIPMGLGIANSVTQFVIKQFENAKNNFPLENIKEKMDKIGAIRRQKLQSVNKKISKGSEKVFESFVSYSDRFFEDRFEEIDEGKPNINAFVLQTSGSKQMVWEFADTKTHKDFLPSFSDSYLGYFLKKIKNVFVNNWKKIIFFLEFDGALLELSQDIPTSTGTFSNNAKMIEKEESRIVSSVLFVFDTVRNKKTTIQKKYVAKIGTRLHETVNQIKVSLFNKSNSNDFVKVKTSFGYRLTKFMSLTLYRKVFSDVNRFTIGDFHFL